MLYTLLFFLSSKCSLFHNANLFGSNIIQILYTECAKIKINKSGAKGLKYIARKNDILVVIIIYIKWYLLLVNNISVDEVMF